MTAILTIALVIVALAVGVFCLLTRRCGCFEGVAPDGSMCWCRCHWRLP